MTNTSWQDRSHPAPRTRDCFFPSTQVLVSLLISDLLALSTRLYTYPEPRHSIRVKCPGWNYLLPLLEAKALASLSLESDQLLVSAPRHKPSKLSWSCSQCSAHRYGSHAFFTWVSHSTRHNGAQQILSNGRNIYNNALIYPSCWQFLLLDFCFPMISPRWDNCLPAS